MKTIFGKLFILLKLFIILIFLTSCTGARELDTLGIVVTTGIDMENGEVVVTNEVINPIAASGSKNGDMTESTEFVQGRGHTVTDAIAQSSLTFDRQLYYPHNHLVIFGEEIAKDGIGKYIDLLSRHTEQREIAYLLVSKGEKAYNIMGVNSGISNSPGKYMYQIIKGQNFNGKTRTLAINEFLRYYYRSQEGYIFGVVALVEKPQINKIESDKTIEVISVEGGAVFEQDKLIGYYTGDEMIGFNLLVDNLKTTAIVFETPSYVEKPKDQISEKGKYSVLKVYKSKTKLDIKLEQEELHLYVDVKIRGILIETTELLNLSDSKILELVADACEKRVEEIIKKILVKAQKEYELDSFSIGELVHRKYPKLWKEIKDDWEEIFTELDYTINVNIAIADTGFTNIPPNLRKGKYNE